MLRLLAAALLSALAAGPAAAEDAKYVKIVHVETGKVLGVVDNSDEPSARIVLAKDDAKEEALQWKIEKDGEFLKIMNRKTGKVLDVNENSTEDGAEIIQFHAKDEGNDNQRFQWVGKETEKRLKAKVSEMVLAPVEGKVQQKKADEAKKDQLWKVVEVK